VAGTIALRTLAGIALVLLAGVILAGDVLSGGGAKPKVNAQASKQLVGAPAKEHVTSGTRGPRLSRGPLMSSAESRAARVPILMYHVVSAPAPGAPNQGLYVDEARFGATVQAFKQAGYHGVTLGEAYDAWHTGKRLPRKPIVFSFDDGYISHYTHAAPALAAAGWPGVLNLELNDLVGKGSLKRWHVRRMAHDGLWEIDSHTITHPDLRTVDDTRLRYELEASATAIRDIVGVTPRFFCYPAGMVDARVAAAVAAAGYEGATTEAPGAATSASDAYQLPRVRVNGSDTPEMVLARVQSLGA
jgi:peptidoglycan/xylan/chitin deacetylase (PgdA/CDA1 family)